MLDLSKQSIFGSVYVQAISVLDNEKIVLICSKKGFFFCPEKYSDFWELFCRKNKTVDLFILPLTRASLWGFIFYIMNELNSFRTLNLFPFGYFGIIRPLLKS